MKYIILITLLFPLFSVSGELESNIVNEFINNQSVDHIPDMFSDNELGELNSYFIYSDTLIAIHWTFKVANYWQERISILEINDSKYTEIDVLEIHGTTTSVETSGHQITVINKTYAENDPRCCPSLLVENIYKVTANGLEKYNNGN